MAVDQALEETSADVLTLVHSSPQLVAKHDKEGWVGIFADGAVVEDPVGSVSVRKGAGVHKGDDELGRFWDTFIAPNEIIFETHLDVLVDKAVARDVTIHTSLPNGFKIGVGAHLLYEVGSVDGVLRVQRMRAFWEMASTSRQGVKGGLKGMAAMMGFFWRIIKINGLGWVWRYCRALYRGIRGRGRKALRSFAEAASSGDVERLRSLLHAPDSACIDHNGKAMGPEEFVGTWDGKVQLSVSKTRATGFFVTATTILARKEGQSQGVVFLGFSRKSRRIDQVRLFTIDHQPEGDHHERHRLRSPQTA
jgi:hypothetical protein